MNILSCMITDKPRDFKHHWKCRDIDLSHHFFADDVLLFSHGDKSSINHIMTSLAQFSDISGLSPNIHKSNVYFCNCKSSVITWFDNEFNIPHGCLPAKFLGVPLISSRLSINMCRPLIQNLTNRILSWTTFTLSFAGRVQLVKSVLFCMQAFWTNHFNIPVGVHRIIKSLFTRFLWKGNTNSNGGAKVAWKFLCLPKEEGGLGLKDSREWNKAQMLFHLCKIINKADSLWANWVNLTLLKKSFFWTMRIPKDCSGLWNCILKLRPLALQFIRYNLGNGINTNFWFHPWWQHQKFNRVDITAIIQASNLPSTTTAHQFISSGLWNLSLLGNENVHPILRDW